MKRTHQLTCLLALTAGLLGSQGALAYNDSGEGMFTTPQIFIAQVSSDERRALRDRWEQASPEERAQMRRVFRDRMRQMPPAEAAPYSSYDNGYGAGYEQRRMDFAPPGYGYRDADHDTPPSKRGRR